MKIDHYKNKEGKTEVYVGDETNGFIMGFMGSDFYWVVMQDYDKGHKFLINKEADNLYSMFKDLFKKIEQADDKYNPVIKNDVFEWISEARPLEVSNKLIIANRQDQFEIEFVKNPDDVFGTDFCAICFCLSGSRNSKIVHEVVMMFQNFISQTIKDKGIQKVFKK